MNVRMTKNSSELFKNARDRGTVEIVKHSDGSADFWFCIQCSVNFWHHLLCNSNGPLIFETVNDALEFLKKRKVYAKNVKFPEE